MGNDGLRWRLESGSLDNLKLRAGEGSASLVRNRKWQLLDHRGDYSPSISHSLFPLWEIVTIFYTWRKVWVQTLQARSTRALLNDFRAGAHHSQSVWGGFGELWFGKSLGAAGKLPAFLQCSSLSDKGTRFASLLLLFYQEAWNRKDPLSVPNQLDHGGQWEAGTPHKSFFLQMFISMWGKKKRYYST